MPLPISRLLIDGVSTNCLSFIGVSALLLMADLEHWEQDLRSFTFVKRLDSCV
jgi:hypothetical protein